MSIIRWELNHFISHTNNTPDRTIYFATWKIACQRVGAKTLQLLCKHWSRWDVPHSRNTASIISMV